MAESEIEKKGTIVDRVGIPIELASRDGGKRRSCRKSERIKKRYYEQICTAFNARVSSSGENGM
jgi:predicted DNA-binding helix-hairpin-helix protein